MIHSEREEITMLLLLPTVPLFLSAGRGNGQGWTLLLMHVTKALLA